MQYESLFETALKIRMVEERVIELYPSDKIQSPVHLSIGQEGVAAGVCSPLQKTDLLFGSYRSHAFYIAKGGNLREMFAELYGKATGCAGGKAGSMHLTAPEVGFMGCSAVVASTIPHAVGAAWAARMLGKDQVTVAVFGDGATEEGVYHESLNFAALHSLPVIFVCENNGLAVHSRIEARQSYRITAHAETYGIPTRRVENGLDFMGVAAVMSELVQAVRAQGGPRYLEIVTSRFYEHVGVGVDYHAGYRSAEEVECWQRIDPLLVDSSLAEALRERLSREIEDAVQFAESSPWPGPEQLLADVF